MSFNKLHNVRKTFINKHKTNDHVIIEGKNNILLSSPHGVSQVRLGRLKFSEIGSLTTALFLSSNTDCYLIAKTKNNNDDANFDDISEYKSSVENLIKNNNIKYIIDLHGLAAKRNCDINLGIHLGQNIKTNETIFINLYNTLIKNNFNTQIDSPFMAGNKTISGSMANKYPDVWSIQIEINCAITNKSENYNRYQLLLKILTQWLNSLI